MTESPLASSRGDGGRRALLLDALGTLLELEPPAPRLRQELDRRFGIQVSQATAHRAVAAEIAYYRAHLDEGRDEASLGRLRHRCAEALSEQLGRELDAPVPGGEAMTEALLASLQFTRFDDVLPVLGDLRGMGLRLVVVSNWDVSLHLVLSQLGVAQLLDAVLTSAEAGVRKPAARIFHRALELAGVVAAKAQHVGDSLEEDVAGARAAGIEPILIKRDESAGPPGIQTIASLRELPSRLARPSE